MTQPAEAVGGEPIAPEPTLDERLDAQLGTIEEAQEEPPVEDTPAEELTEEDIPPEEETDDLPPIDAPVSWDAEAKERFAKLPREDQEYLSKREGERERFVQQKSQEATRARTEVEQEAHNWAAQYDQQVSERLNQLAAQIAPQRPNPALLQHDPVTFYNQQAEYENAVAQQRELQQQAQQYAQQSQAKEQAAEQAHMAQQHQIIVENFPEYADPTTRPKLEAELTAVARELGYPIELIHQARATDVLAMRTAAEWKAKSAKYDALMSKQMANVRAAKGKPPIAAKPGSAQAPGASRQAQYTQDREALRNGDAAATQRVLDSFFVKPK